MFRREMGIFFSTNMSGKMAGMCAITTAVTCNARCARNAQIPGSICAKCYAAQYIAARKTVETAYAGNSAVLSAGIIPIENMVRINPRAWSFIRIESFGDVANVTTAINYTHLCRRNPRVTFAAWTKNLDLWEAAFEADGGKPDNLILVASSIMVNRPIDVRNHPAVDKVFTVYTADYIIAHGLRPEFINCGARSCKTCRRCYRKTGAVEYVNEILKQDISRVQKYWASMGWL